MLKDAVASERRLIMLRVLADQTGHKVNESVLQVALERFGFAASRDLVRTELTWLQEQGVVAVETVHAQVYVAQLTARGLDIALGRTVQPGISRPAPTV